MRTHKEIYFIKANKETIFDVIANIEHYPVFLPWCVGARIIENKTSGVVILQKAELIISFKSFKEKFISNIELDKSNWTIVISSNKKPFKSLNGRWSILELKNECKVSFEIEFEFKSIILEKFMGLFFYNAVKSIVSAFERQCIEDKN